MSAAKVAPPRKRTSITSGTTFSYAERQKRGTSVLVNVTMDAADRDVLVELSEKLGKSRSAIVRECIAALARKHGLEAR